ncbi:MAG: M14 family zinc carboxypeptidase [Planctomycetota bacterium]
MHQRSEPVRPHLVFLVCLLAGLLQIAPATHASLTLTGDFDHGALQDYTVSGSATAPEVDLVGRDNFYGDNEWRWMNFKATGALGLTPEFIVDQPFAGGLNRLQSHPMVYSYDGENWEFFDNSGLQNFRGRPPRFEFSNNTPFTQDEVQIAYAFPYSYGDSVAHTQSVLQSPWAEPTASALPGRANAAGIIGFSPGGTDDLGRTISPQNIYAYRITNPATDSPTEPKRKVVITTGMHAGETLGTHTFAGLVDWLISDDPRAAELRDIAEFFAYPTMNPDGRLAGNNRATVQNPDRDPNGFWNPALWVPHQDIAVNGQAMIDDVASTPGTVDAFIDFHSTIPFDADDFGFIEFEQGDNQADWWLRLRELQPNVQEIDSTSTTWTSANFAEAFLTAQVDVTFETMFGFNRELEYYTQLGANFGIAFHDSWVPEPNSIAIFAAFGMFGMRRRKAA